MLGLISAFIGAIIGGAITYVCSTKLLKQQLEMGQAYEFVSKNYLPLRSALELNMYIGATWMAAEKTGLGESEKDEIINIYNRTISPLLDTALENFIKSGTICLVEKIDKELFRLIEALDFQIQQRKLRIKKGSFDINNPEDTFGLPDTKFCSELRKKVSMLDIPQLVNVYQNAMKRGYKVQEET